MVLEDKKNAFIELGKFLKQFSGLEYSIDESVPYNFEFYSPFASLIETAVHSNGWFTKEQIVTAITSWSRAMTREKLDNWTSEYSFDLEPLKKIGLVLAGNIPMVGFHDLLCVLISGNRALVKTSSNDQKLVPFLMSYLIAVEPRFKDRVEFVKDRIEGFDAVIATGSNNTARYFEYYFGKYPSIIRKNRNSVAVLTGSETKQDLEELGKDIFTYYGLGCRNVSKLFVPVGYDFSTFFEAMHVYKEMIKYEKYANNYDYNKAVFLMSEFKILDNGFVTIKEDQGYASPIATVFYEFYDSLENLEHKLRTDKELIQCVVSKEKIAASIPFGKTQEPELWDYADGVDTMEFLLKQ